MFKKVFIIINPAAGKFEPILPVINSVLHTSPVLWDIGITHRDGDVARLCKSALTKRYDAIAVYGGDGSIMEAAQVLFKRTTPLVILPGGTANVVAKELNIPQTLEEATKLLLNKQVTTKRVDMGTVNNKPFLVRINIGFMADILTGTSQTQKNKLGRIAYATTTVKNLMAQHDPIQYHLILDGKRMTKRGVSLVIANAGNTGIGNISLHPHISITDGYLNVLLYHHLNTQGVLDVARQTITAQQDTQTVDHWKAKEISVTLDQSTTVIHDDVEIKRKQLNISVSPESLYVVC